MNQPEGTIDPAAAATAAGTTYWRSLEQLENPAITSDEFADGASEPPVLDDVSRRKFLGLDAATAAVAGMTSCRKPVTHILPFARRPEDLVPGIPNYYATAYVKDGVGTGILVKSSDGRPTKVEGNPLHPSSLGGTDHLIQAELLNLYDPARSQHPVDHSHHEAGNGHDAGHGNGHATGHPTVANFLEFWNAKVPAQGTGLRLLVEPTSSPSVHAALNRLKEKYPAAVVHHWSPVHNGAAVTATRKAFGRALDTQYDLTKADVVVSIDCDFQSQDGNNVRNARDFASRRRITDETQVDKLSRLYVLENFHSVTGSNADHRFRLRPSEIGDAVMALAAELQANHGVAITGDYAAFRSLATTLDYQGKKWIPILAKELAAKKGRSALLIGPRLPVDVQVVLHALNVALGNTGKTVSYTQTPAGMDEDCGKSITELTNALDQGTVQTLLILGGNPVFNAPADLDFGTKMAKAKNVVHLSQYLDETSTHKACSWHLNQAHDLETWGDILSHDGTATLMQPLIAPLYEGLSTLETIALLTDGVVKVKFKEGLLELERDRSGYELVRETWKARASGSFQTFWSRALHDGTVNGSKPAAVQANLQNAGITSSASRHKPGTPGSMTSLEVQFRPSYNLHDGRYANNMWLMELPDPMTKICWDNAALMSLATMKKAGLSQGDQVEFTLGDKKIKAPVWVLPGHADFTVTLTLGYGRGLDEHFHTAHGAGFNAYALRTVASHHQAVGLQMSKKVGTYKIVVTQEHGQMEGRALVRENDTAGYQKEPNFAPDANPLAQVAKIEALHHSKEKHGEGEKHGAEDPHSHEHQAENPERPESLWKASDLNSDPKSQWDYSKGNQWGMVIDLNTCTGCNACVSACVAENNIPMVGKEQVGNGREMFWNRIDRYFGSDTESNVKSAGVVPAFSAVPPAENPKVVHQMVPCMQCENASCEVVCPVAATSHSPEGLNDMAYNRCIGTRYCGNNCPYKVRKFNYLDFHGEMPEQTKMVQNPDVTVRSRGVMEKCTYCVQRINRVKIEAKVDGRRGIKDGEIKTACEESCPTQAITFGDINDPASRVSTLKKSNLNYGLLAELNMRPRTTYLAKIRNPNPELVNAS